MYSGQSIRRSQKKVKNSFGMVIISLWCEITSIASKIHIVEIFVLV